MNEPEILKDILFRRQSVTPPFYDTERKIPDEIVLELLEAANRAPNHKRTEPWRFVVFSGDGLKTFANLQAGIYREHAPAFSEVTHKKLSDFPLMCSHIIAVIMKRNEEKKLPEIEEVAACACAMQNIFLMATAYGIASYISTGGITYYPQTKDYFNLNEDDKVLGFIHLGYARQPAAVPKSRGDVSEKIKWVK